MPSTSAHVPCQSLFLRIRRVNDAGIEFWSSRDLASVLGYSDYADFLPVLAKAKRACFNSGMRIDDHFLDITETISSAPGHTQALPAVFLSRFACYLLIQNADPRLHLVALGQAYLALQTLRQQLNRGRTEEESRLLLRRELRKHNTQLAKAARGAGVVDAEDYSTFQNHGYMGLYGGLDAKSIHAARGLKKSQQILDHMGSTELAANLFRATQTEEKLRRDQVKNKQAANQTHFEVGNKVRQTIQDLGGTPLEHLPAAESIKKLESKRKKSFPN